MVAFEHKIFWQYCFRPRIRADDWTLVISSTEARDAGTYECSVNTLPKISHTVALAVKEMAMAVIFLNNFLFNLYEAFFCSGLSSPRTTSSEQADEVDRREPEKYENSRKLWTLGSGYRDRTWPCIFHLRAKGNEKAYLIPIQYTSFNSKGKGICLWCNLNAILLFWASSVYLLARVCVNWIDPCSGLYLFE